nr:hypothetical protein [uncultured Treponema sp.]
MDKHIEESGCYEKGHIRCAKCNEIILDSISVSCKQENGSYICDKCQSNEDSEKHRERMGRG